MLDHAVEVDDVSAVELDAALLVRVGLHFRLECTQQLRPSSFRGVGAVGNGKIAINYVINRTELAPNC